MKILLATNNPHKKIEIERHLNSQFEILNPKDLNIDFEVEETGTTFEENAAIKSEHLYSLTGLISIADDSGICVRALNNRPGVYSARYGTEDMDDKDRAMHLLSELEGVKDRYAYYYCSICISSSGGNVFFNGICEGEISTQYIDGGYGFGYDPVFYYPPFKKLFSEVPLEEKNKVSHRGLALEKLVQYLQETKF